MLSAALRDLHAAHPGAFFTNVVSSCPDIFEHNPNVRPVGDEGELIHCSYDPRELAHTGLHFVHAFRLDLEQQLGVPISQGPLHGDIHLSHEELAMPCPVAGPFWLINAGVKPDFTCKLWHRYQAVVDHFRGRLQFVQVGAAEHLHPALDGVIDLRGKTSLRELIRLVYHSTGVLSGVSLLPHLAPAVAVCEGRGARACVVVAGAREPRAWEAYEGHRFLSNVGSLPCCAERACWKSRTVPLHDGLEHDEKLCEKPVEIGLGQHVPACMDLIGPEAVCEAVESYLT